MLVAVSVPRFVAALMLAVVSTTVFAEYGEPSISKDNESITFYRESCKNLKDALVRVEGSKGQIELSSSFKSGDVDYLESKSGLTGLSAEETTRCSAFFAKAKNILAAEAAAEAAETKKRYADELIAYRKTPEYKHAQSMGYEDIGGIAYLKLYEDRYGEEGMKKVLYNVDAMCGKNFRAVQYSAPYVVYAMEACGTEKKVAILGTKNVSSGDFFDTEAGFEYVGWRKIVEPNGFTVEIRTLRQLGKR
ncbi:hypothetical protein PSCICM_36810 [Pseudomonas cichorii]|uniref:hypothetical protein n=1 Tax=Pseudomonas cichorii TaxID=36746 RepID=UPI0019110BEE|nr:hypothetical protein [Pseudomonas cichorii]GFM77862.1 hypothetical protein PSCICM_36810 [Pseudomonas cichorii]